MQLINNDYRNTLHSIIALDILEKKTNLEELIRSKHSKIQIIYNLIKDKKKEYFLYFANIYNSKCAYCGLDVDIFPLVFFEIDHFISEDSFPKTLKGRSNAGKIENLVLACYYCNRGKGNFKIEKEYKNILNPDNSSIAKVFIRDKNYNIIINPNYNRDPVINNFYKKLFLNHEFRRLDYLLMMLNDLINHTKDDKLIGLLSSIFHNLLKRRNKIIPD